MMVVTENQSETTQPGPLGEEYLTVQELLVLANTSYSTLYRAIKAGRFPAPVRVIGQRRIMFRRSEVEAHLAAL